MLKNYLELPRAVHILCLGTFINRAGSFFIVFLTIYLSEKLGFDVTFATRCMGVFGLGAIVGTLTGGHLADNIGRRKVMLMSLFGGAVVMALFGYLRTKSAIMGATLIYAMIIEMYRPSASAMIADLVSPKQRSHAFGLMYVSLNLGFACGAYFGGILAKQSFQLLFWGDALTTSTYACIIFFLVRETLPKRNLPVVEAIPSVGAVANEGDPPTVDDALPVRQSPVPLFEAVVRILSDGPFLVFCGCSLMMGLIFMQDMATLPLFLKSLGFSPEDYGSVIAINGILIVICQLPLTAFFSRYDRQFVIMGGAVMLGLGFGLTAQCTTLWQFRAAVIIATIGEMMQSPFKSAVVTDLAPVDLRARYMGVFTMCYSSALMLGAPLGGEILNRYGGNYLWWGCFGVAMVAVVGYIAVYKSIKARHVALIHAQERR